MNNLLSMDRALVCSGPMSNFSYDSHPVSRRRMEDELPRGEQSQSDSYTAQQMEVEIQRVARELYKAFSGLNEEFKDAKDQIVIDELSSHTDSTRKELIHPYKTLYGRDLNQVLRDNLGNSWEDACAILMSEMRMYELECLRRRMEDETSGQGTEDTSCGVGWRGRSQVVEDIIDSCIEDQFTGHSCLLITWKTNPEVEQFKQLYMETEVKTHKRRSKTLVDPGDLVSEKSLHKVYKILGKGEGVERLLVKGKKEDQVEEVDGDDFRYFLLAGTTHPYPDDTFYSVGRVPRKLLLKYLGIKMYLVRLRKPPQNTNKVADWKICTDIADLALNSAGILSPKVARRNDH